jgi:hypothetical protein
LGDGQDRADEDRDEDDHLEQRPERVVDMPTFARRSGWRALLAHTEPSSIATARVSSA